MECPIGFDKIHCQNCYFVKDGKCQYKKMMANKAESGHVALLPMLWGMGFIAVGFILYPLVGWFWTLVTMGVVGLGGMFIGIKMLKQADKKPRQRQGADNDNPNQV